jgi:hypothetical protein
MFSRMTTLLMALVLIGAMLGASPASASRKDKKAAKEAEKEAAKNAAAPVPAPPPVDPELQKKILDLINIVEYKPSGLYVNNNGKVDVPPDHQPYNPDGSRNENFTVTHDTPGGEVPLAANEARRQQSIKDLIAIGRPAVDELCKALTRDYFLHRDLYAFALGEIRDPRAVPALLKYYQDGLEKLKNVPFVRQNGDEQTAVKLETTGNKMVGDAATALQKITGQAYGNDFPKWQAWWDANKAQVGPTPNLIEYTANPPDGSSSPEYHFDPSLMDKPK